MNNLSNPRVWELSTDTPTRSILEWSVRVKNVDRLLLAARLDRDPREPKPLTPTVENTVVQIFGKHIIDRKPAQKWPGTELIGHDGLIYEVAFDASLINSMSEAGRRLCDWQERAAHPLPEDPCLFRLGDAWPLLASVTHEGKAWILSNDRPPFSTSGPFPLDPENLIIPPAAGGFVAR